MRNFDGDSYEIMWKGILFPSLEMCRLNRYESGWLLEGSFTAKYKAMGLTVAYQIKSDEEFNSNWRRNRIHGCVDKVSWPKCGTTEAEL
ncbi:MAG: hypothetical protein M0T81_01140 [Thermoplasmatales archaeon]|nr:hypothetical protein [Thermoplasmatales archaeon]